MRTMRLARVAAEAEMLRLRRMGRRLAISAGLLLVACLFVTAAFLLAHLAMLMLLIPAYGQMDAVLFVLAGDVAVVVLLGVLVVFNSPGRIERQALEVRQTARLQIVESLTFAALLTGLTRAIATRRFASAATTVFQIFARHSKQRSQEH